MAALPKIGLCIEGYSPPEVFVGLHGYPVVRAGPMITAREFDQEPTALQPTLAMDIGEIIAHRASLIRSESNIGVHEAKAPGRLLETAQQIAMSSAPVGTEVSFLKPPQGSVRFDGVLSPTGPAGTLKEMEITTNPVIPRKVDQIVEDQAIGAAPAISELYMAGINVDHISRLLSLGLLGNERKLVPTRWSITASDDKIGKSLKEAVLDKPLIRGYNSTQERISATILRFYSCQGPIALSWWRYGCPDRSGRRMASSALTTKGQEARRITAL